MGSRAYKEHLAIIILFDESEQNSVAGDNPDDFCALLRHSIEEIDGKMKRFVPRPHYITRNLF
jgi:hypothetical protein